MPTSKVTSLLLVGALWLAVFSPLKALGDELGALLELLHTIESLLTEEELNELHHLLVLHDTLASPPVL